MRFPVFRSIEEGGTSDRIESVGVRKTLRAISEGLLLATASVCFSAGCGLPQGTIVANCYRDATAPDSGEIYLVLDGRLHPLLPDGFYPENVSVSADRFFIAYSKGQEEEAEIYVMDVRTRKETRITSNPHPDYNPNLSPDGSKVVYWSHRQGGIGIYISDSDGRNEQSLLDIPDTYSFDPEWSHDGTMIAFNLDTSSTGCKGEIHVGVLNERRTGFEGVFSVSSSGGAHLEVDPAWSMDDSRLVYLSYEGPGCWVQEGLQEANLQYWKLKTVLVDRTNRVATDETIVWESDGHHVNWIPIWTEKEREILAIRSEFLGLPHTPFGTRSSLIRYDIETGEEAAIEGTEDCFWLDYAW